MVQKKKLGVFSRKAREDKMDREKSCLGQRKLAFQFFAKN